MMVWSFLGAPLLAVALGASPGNETWKCPARVAGEHLPDVVVVVDGKPIHEDLDSLPVPEDAIWSVKIICWDLAERLFDVRTRRGAAVVVTKRGLLPMMESYLEDLVVAQRGHRSRQGAFAKTLRDLNFFDSHLELPIEMTAAPSAWSAAIRPGGYTHTCRVAGYIQQDGSVGDGRVRCVAVEAYPDGGAR